MKRGEGEDKRRITNREGNGNGNGNGNGEKSQRERVKWSC